LNCRNVIGAVAVVFAIGVLSVQAQPAAPAYPSRPARIIAGFSPGGSTDIMARIVAQKLTDALQQQVVVENRPGANGNIAAEVTAKAPPDGYTLLMAANGLTINPSLYKKVPYHPVKDFSPITLFALIPNVLVVHPALPAKSIKGLIALARAKPDQLTHGSSGTGAPGHLAGEVFKLMANVRFIHIAYKGSSQAVIDLMGGHVQLAFPTIPVVTQHIRSGKLRALGVTSLKRSASLPETPTIDEAGVRGYEVVGWYGVLAPAGVPRDIITRLNTEIAKALRAPDLQERLLRDGAEPVGNTPDEFRAYIEADVVKWAKVIDAAGIRFEP
jgi:tripartite-type tricarboxylate transporter receptor subunit TctC